MLPTALIPVRIAPTAKRRLAHALRPEERMRLVRSFFEHVVSVVGEAGLPAIALSPTAMEAPEGVEVWLDEKSGLNAAVGAALHRLGTPALVVHADLPRLSVGDIEEALSSDADVVVARAHDGGTNALLLRRLIAPAFGVQSALVHAERAREAGLRVRVVDVPGFALDVDDEAGLRSVSAVGVVSSPGTRP